MTWVASRVASAVAGNSAHAAEVELHFHGEVQGPFITPSEFEDYLDDLVARGIKIINQSFSINESMAKPYWGYNQFDYLEDRFLAKNPDTILIKAAGNVIADDVCPGDENPTVDCQALNTLCVGSHSAAGTIRDFSDDFMSCNSRWKNPILEEGVAMGDLKEMERPDLVAEGYQGWIANARETGDWVRTLRNSTSFAAPTVAGLVALTRQACGYKQRNHVAAWLKAGAYVNTTSPGHKLETKSSLIYPTPGRSEDSVAGAGIVYARPVLCSNWPAGAAPSPLDPDLPGDPGGSSPGQGTGPNGNQPGTPLGPLLEPTPPDETVFEPDATSMPSEPAPGWMFGEAANDDSRGTQDEWGQLPSSLRVGGKNRSSEGMKPPAGSEQDQASRLSGTSPRRIAFFDFSNPLGGPARVTADSRIRAVIAFNSCPAAGGTSAVADLRPGKDFDLALCSDANQKCYGISDSWDDNREGFDVRIPSIGINDLKLYILYSGSLPPSDCSRELAVTAHLWTDHL